MILRETYCLSLFFINSQDEDKNSMKKLLVILIFVFSQSIPAMELQEWKSVYHSKAFLIESDCNQNTYYEMGLNVAWSVPHIQSVMEKYGRTSMRYSNVNQKDLNNFGQYASNRFSLQSSVQSILGPVIGNTAQIEKEHNEFLTKMPIPELSQLTIMAVDMYEEPFPKDLYDPWQKHVSSEIKQCRGKGEFLENFKDKKEIGEFIFSFCFAAGGHEEEITLLASERWIEKQKLEETQKHPQPKKEETVVINDDELGWRKTLSQMRFTLRQKCAEYKIAIGGISLVAAIAAYLYWRRTA
jgi:hypothetical protein